MNKKQFLLQLQAVNLIAVDLHLFLDTHPDNKEALNDYEKVSKQYQSLKQQYEQQFGPLVSFGYSSRRIFQLSSFNHATFLVNSVTGMPYPRIFFAATNV